MVTIHTVLIQSIIGHMSQGIWNQWNPKGVTVHRGQWPNYQVSLKKRKKRSFFIRNNLEIKKISPLSFSWNLRISSLSNLNYLWAEGYSNISMKIQAVTPSLAMPWNQNFIMSVTGHKMWWIDWVSTLVVMLKSQYTWDLLGTDVVHIYAWNVVLNNA